MGILASTHNAPSFSCGKNSVPNHLVEKSVAPRKQKATIILVRL